jgi:outer membrane protein
MTRVISFCTLLFFSVTGYSQSTWTLQQCIDTALANNIPVKQQYLRAQSAEIDWHQSRSNLLPNLSADVFHGINQGRSIDPYSNSYVTQSYNFANYQMNSGVTLFNGGYLQNTVRQYASAYEAAKM